MISIMKSSPLTVRKLGILERSIALALNQFKPTESSILVPDVSDNWKKIDQVVFDEGSKKAIEKMRDLADQLSASVRALKHSPPQS
jgi:hypothetical protein